jgi:hypothetical protein
LEEAPGKSGERRRHLVRNWPRLGLLESQKRSAQTSVILAQTPWRQHVDGGKLRQLPFDSVAIRLEGDDRILW